MDAAYLEIQKAYIVSIQIDVIAMQTKNMTRAFQGQPPAYDAEAFQEKVSEVQSVIQTIVENR